MSSSRAPLPFVVTWRRAIVESELSSTQRLICFVLSDHMDAGGRCRVSQQRICRGAGLSSRRAIDKNLPEIERAGYLTLERRHGECSRYFARLPDSANLVLEPAHLVPGSDAAEPAHDVRTPAHLVPGTCAPGAHEVEKKEKIDDVADRALRKILRDLGGYQVAQFEELATHFVRDRDRFERRAREAKSGKRPIGLLLSFLRADPADEPEQLSLESDHLDTALRWAEGAGAEMLQEDADDILDDRWQLSDEGREAVRRKLDECRQRRTGTDS